MSAEGSLAWAKNGFGVSSGAKLLLIGSPSMPVEKIVLYWLVDAIRKPTSVTIESRLDPV